MKGKQLIFLLLLLAGFSLVGCMHNGPVANVAVPQTERPGIAVIELFTSEGCSSCPPAEKLMPELKAQYGDNLFVIAYHVDYWDRMGWKDKFSQKAYTDLQYQYAATFGNASVYTPQAVVNGKAHVTGSNRQSLEALIKQEMHIAPADSIRLSAKAYGDSIAVSYSTGLTNEESLRWVLVQKEVTVNVGKGENAGRTLTHHNVALATGGQSLREGSFSIQLPPGSRPAEYQLIAFIQNNLSLNINTAARVGIE